jgi:hypothetical protein
MRQRHSQQTHRLVCIQGFIDATKGRRDASGVSEQIAGGQEHPCIVRRLTEERTNGSARSRQVLMHCPNFDVQAAADVINNWLTAAGYCHQAQVGPQEPSLVDDVVNKYDRIIQRSQRLEAAGWSEQSRTNPARHNRVN